MGSGRLTSELGTNGPASVVYTKLCARRHVLHYKEGAVAVQLVYLVLVQVVEGGRSRGHGAGGGRDTAPTKIVKLVILLTCAL